MYIESSMRRSNVPYVNICEDVCVCVCVCNAYVCVRACACMAARACARSVSHLAVYSMACCCLSVCLSRVCLIVLSHSTLTLTFIVFTVQHIAHLRCVAAFSSVFICRLLRLLTPQSSPSLQFCLITPTCGRRVLRVIRIGCGALRCGTARRRTPLRCAARRRTASQSCE